MGSYLDVEYEYEYEDEFELESDDMSLAAELLEVSSDEELEYFLGNLVRKASKSVGGFVKSSTGRALTSILKKAAKKALPVVGGAVGNHFGGARWGRFGRNAGNAAGRAFGLELEGLTEEDQEFETAKQFIRFAKTAARKAATSNHGLSSATVATKAAKSAAKRYAPGLVRSLGHSNTARCGRWVRRGNNIILLNA